jgi:hypothetical protein
MQRFLLILILTAPSSIFALTFGPFTSISPTGGNGNPPLIAVAGNGNAIAVWVNFPNTIQAAFFNGTTFLPAFVVDTGSAPQIGIDQGGNAFIIYVTLLAPTQILVKRFTSSNLTLAAAVQLSTPGTSNSSPQIAVSQNGNALAVWLQNAPAAVLSKAFSPSVTPGPPFFQWSASPTQIPFLPAGLGLDATAMGFAIINNLSGIPPGTPQGTIQVSRIAASP